MTIQAMFAPRFSLRKRLKYEKLQDADNNGRKAKIIPNMDQKLIQLCLWRKINMVTDININKCKIS